MPKAKIKYTNNSNTSILNILDTIVEKETMTDGIEKETMLYKHLYEEVMEENDGMFSRML